MPLVKALIAQLGGIALVFVIGRSGWPPPMSPLALACMQGFFAMLIAAVARAPRWWLPIHVAFMPVVVMAMSLALPAWLYLCAFIAFATVYWTTFRTQVPLFLSNRITVHRLAIWLPDRPGVRVLDLGSGTGSMIRLLGRLRPDWHLTGIEAAPGPAVLAKWCGRRQTNVQLARGDFWRAPLSDYDVVYAFLSPVPMRALWRKARKEMKPASWLISNSFPIPDVKPAHVLSVDDRRGTRLYCYRVE